MDDGGLVPRDRVACFLGQLAVESLQLTRWEEKLSYTADRLAVVWPSRFRGLDGKPNARAREMADRPEALANLVYADRLGNGPPESGDGWRYRGRGPVQTTGLWNFRRAGAALGLPLVDHPELLAQDRPGVDAAVLFGNDHSCSVLADAGDIEEITRRIQGGHRDVERRRAFTRRALDVLP